MMALRSREKKDGALGAAQSHIYGLAHHLQRHDHKHAEIDAHGRDAGSQKLWPIVEHPDEHARHQHGRSPNQGRISHCRGHGEADALHAPV